MVVALIVAVGCSRNETRLRLAESLSKSADECLVTVRDGNQVYDDVPACVALDGLNRAYIDSGGLIYSEATQASADYVKYAVGRGTAWMAVALSNARHPRRARESVW